jgi:hypothetical protein
MSNVYHYKLEILDDLKNLMNDFYSEMINDLVRRVLRSFFYRAQLCIKPKGDHFEHFNSQAKKMLQLQ